MNKKKITLVAFALVLICAVSVVGAFAYLTASTADKPVVNTFVYAGGDKKFVTSLTLQEHKVTQNGKGAYETTSDLVTENTYNVVPGTTLPKDAFITVSGKNAAPAYLYLEVVGTLNNVFNYSVNTENWTALDSVTGAKGGTVYVYKNSTIVNDTNAGESLKVEILMNNKITIADTATEDDLIKTTLTFYAYLAQATVGESSDAATVYSTCFASTND